MGVVEGGSKCNLITGYSAGEDTDINYGRHRWLAQTFTLDELYVVWRCRFKSWTIDPGEFYEYAIRATDAAGKPTGADIYTTTLSPTGEDPYSPGKWRRFDFSAFPNLPAGQYALIARVPTSTWTNTHKLRADGSTPTFYLGKAWKSNDSGVTWTEIANTDFMFEIWGWLPPPPEDPPPVLSNWAPLDEKEIDCYPGVTIVVTTDIPVHLFKRWTDIEPLTHAEPLFRRGIALDTATRFCFVAFKEDEQQEQGDTLIHTFVQPDWQVCETHWFYFIGTKQAEESPSASPIFSFHKVCDTPPPAFALFSCFPVQTVTLTIDKWQHAGFTFTLSQLSLCEKVQVWLAKTLTSEATNVTASIYETLASGQPNGQPLASVTVDCSWIKRIPLWDLVEFEFDDILTLHPDKQYILWLSAVDPWPIQGVLTRSRHTDVCPLTSAVRYRVDLDTWYYLPNYDSSFRVWGNLVV